MNPTTRTILAVAVVVIGLAFIACGPGGSSASTPTATATPTATPTATALARPIGYTLPSGCDLVGNGEKRDETTYWRVACSASGSLRSVLSPSLASQGWEECGVAGPFSLWRIEDWLITLNLSDTSASGELGETRRFRGCGPLGGE
jgi:hypothetical protein